MALVGALWSTSVVVAWTSRVHRVISSQAVEYPAGVAPAWTADEKRAIVSASVLPDLMRPAALPQLRSLEGPRHYLDLEVLEGRSLPGDYWGFVQILVEIANAGGGAGLLRPGGDVTQIGTLPYALVESTQRLAAVFALWRLDPEESSIRDLAAYQAGRVAHYAQDLCQPLHTSIHHDGRARADGTSPYTGIHRQIDDVLLEIPLESVPLSRRQPRELKPLLSGIVSALEESHSQVDRVYELAPALQALYEDGSADPALVQFLGERYRQAVALTADLIFTAWQLSATVEVPGWTEAPDLAVPTTIE